LAIGAELKQVKSTYLRWRKFDITRCSYLLFLIFYFIDLFFS
jgi:hypothetical protein